MVTTIIIILNVLVTTVLFIYATGLRKRLRESLNDNFKLKQLNHLLDIDKASLNAERMNAEQKLTEQRADAEGLGDVAIEACLLHALFVGRHRQRGDRSGPAGMADVDDLCRAVVGYHAVRGPALLDSSCIRALR